jgi:hypothetical protein
VTLLQEDGRSEAGLIPETRMRLEVPPLPRHSLRDLAAAQRVRFSIQRGSALANVELARVTSLAVRLNRYESFLL